MKKLKSDQDFKEKYILYFHKEISNFLILDSDSGKIYEERKSGIKDKF